MDTATWSSIGSIFFWCADNSEAARYKNKGNIIHMYTKWLKYSAQGRLLDYYFAYFKYFINNF